MKWFTATLKRGFAKCGFTGFPLSDGRLTTLYKPNTQHSVSKYQVDVLEQTVHRWGKDGQGDYVCSKGGFTFGVFPKLDDATQALNHYFGFELGSDAYQGEYISVNRIEDVDAYTDPDGDYIVDYVLCIDKIDRVSFGELSPVGPLSIGS